MKYTKIDDKTLEVEKTIPEEIIPAKIESKRYDIDFLKGQKIRVEGDLASVVARHVKELELAQGNVDEVNKLITEAENLGISASEAVIP